MATIALGTSFEDGTNAASYISGAFGVAAGDLLVAFVQSWTTTVQYVYTDGVGVPWYYVGSVAYSSGSGYVHCYVCTTREPSATSVSVVIDMTGTGSGVCVSIMVVTGMSRAGSSAVRLYSAATGGGGTAPTVNWGGNCDATDVLCGAVANVSNPAAIAPPPSWTEQSDGGYDSRAGMESASRHSSSTTMIVVWGNSPSAWGAIAIALNTTIPPASGTMHPTLGSATQAASGTETIQGAAASTLGSVTHAASGNTIDPPSGYMASTLGDVTHDAQGEVVITGEMSSTLGDVTHDAQGEVVIAGEMSSTLGDVTHDAQGEVVIAGEMSSTLGDVTQVARGHSRTQHRCCPSSIPIRHCGQRDPIYRVARPCIKVNQPDRTLRKFWRPKIPRVPK